MHSTSLRALLVLLLAITSTQILAWEIQLEAGWRVEGLDGPESVILDPTDESRMLVSNINGEPDDKDGNGYISIVSIDGDIIQRKWAVGLNAPKGLAIRGGILYVADIDELVLVDSNTGEIKRRMVVAGAKFLNDVALSPDGLVLISDSSTGKIFARDGSEVREWLSVPELGSVNGLLAEKERLVVGTMRGLLLAVDWKTKSLETLADGLGDIDGISKWRNGYLVTEWPGRIIFVSPIPNEDARTILDTQNLSIYQNDFVRVGSSLIVPNLKPGSLSLHRIRLREPKKF